MSGKKLEAHLFVCTNEKKGECCGEKGGAKLRSKVKDLAKDHPEWKGRVRVNAAGCLGRCEEGIVAVLYPQGQWFTSLDKDDSEVLVEAIDQALKSE